LFGRHVEMASGAVIQQILASLPGEWLGTTFKNSQLLGREGFAENLNALLSRNEPVTVDDLEALGNAEDYLRVATNISTTLEVFLARERGYHVSQVFTFASARMPIVAVVLTARLPVILYIGNEQAPFTPEQIRLLELLKGRLTITAGSPQPVQDHVVLALQSSLAQETTSGVDGIIGEHILYINKPETILPEDILVMRKRMSTPVTTPVAQVMLQRLAGITVDGPVAPEPAKLMEFLDHLQTMSGTEANAKSHPVVFTAGLPTIASLWLSLVQRGGADIVMASTAYGGSSQLTDLLAERAESLRKFTFDIQGVDTNIIQRIGSTLDHLAEQGSSLAPTTVLFVEIPTNPDMKVPDTPQLAPILRSYKEKTGKEVLLLVDTTFAPASQVMKKFQEETPELPVMCFISLSKSVSRGITTAGALVANHTEFSTSLLKEVSATATFLDTTAKPDQLTRLVDNHIGVEVRCERAYQVAAAVGVSLCENVMSRCAGYDMPLAFVTPEQAQEGFTTSTFSFNLPSPSGASEEEKEALAQRFVDLLCEHKEFKPCVSFGQDNGLVYATVPATSTQGAIKEEDKAKQAVGGVQLVRLSFAPSSDIHQVSNIIQSAINAIYQA
jgi:hypothetical protein